MERLSVDSGFYEEHEFNGYTKSPTKEWYWVHDKQTKCSYPQSFTDGKY
jgi:hypothetical protein